MPAPRRPGLSEATTRTPPTAAPRPCPFPGGWANVRLRGARAFTSARDSLDNFNVYRMNADGFGQTRLTDAPGMNRGPSWSADGTKITFPNATDLAVPGEIFEMEADGSVPPPKDGPA